MHNSTLRTFRERQYHWRRGGGDEEDTRAYILRPLLSTSAPASAVPVVSPLEGATGRAETVRHRPTKCCSGKPRASSAASP